MADDLVEIVEPSKDSNGALSSVMGPVMEICESVTKRVKSVNELEALLKKGTEASGMEEAQVVGVVLAVILGLLFLFSGFSIIALFAAWVYPMYRSCQAVRDSKDADSLKKWLKYWVVYGIVNFTLFFADYVVSWFPMYGLLKVGLYIGLWHPSVNGADVVFTAVVERVFLKVGSD